MKRLASGPTRLRFRIGPGPDGGASKLKELRAQMPDKSGAAAERSAKAGTAIAAMPQSKIIRLTRREISLEADWDIAAFSQCELGCQHATRAVMYAMGHYLS